MAIEIPPDVLAGAWNEVLVDSVPQEQLLQSPEPAALDRAVEVLSGLAAGETVAVAGAADLGTAYASVH